MKQYPSISRSTGQAFQEFDAHVFAKIDGSNLRFEWNKKKGWYKFGTRNRMFDHTDQVFGPAIDIWKNGTGLEVEKIARDQKWESVVAFGEFHGPGSFAGLHIPEEPKEVTLFDVSPYKKGILGPKEFLKLFGHLNIAPYLGQHKWTRGLVESVSNGEFPGMTFEGVVGKSGSDHDLIMAKAKNQKWIDAVLAKYGDSGVILI